MMLGALPVLQQYWCEGFRSHHKSIILWLWPFESGLLKTALFSGNTHPWGCLYVTWSGLWIHIQCILSELNSSETIIKFGKRRHFYEDIFALKTLFAHNTEHCFFFFLRRVHFYESVLVSESFWINERNVKKCKSGANIALEWGFISLGKKRC